MEREPRCGLICVNPKTFYIETFGCQMNLHDSEKVIGTLLRRGYTQVESPEQAEFVFYNTCSIRDKAEQKVYRHHTRYPGGLRETTAREMIAKRPERVIELAIKGMLPKNKLGKAMAKKLKVYADAEHPHSAQRPQVYNLTQHS